MDFIKIVNAEHGIYELTTEADECSNLAKLRTENCRILRANSALIKFSGIMAGLTVLALIIR